MPSESTRTLFATASRWVTSLPVTSWKRWCETRKYISSGWRPSSKLSTRSASRTISPSNSKLLVSHLRTKKGCRTAHMCGPTTLLLVTLLTPAGEAHGAAGPGWRAIAGHVVQQLEVQVLHRTGHRDPV